jgi:hypothetical protein
MANKVANKFVDFFSFLLLLFSLSPPYYFSPRRGCPRVVKIRVKLDEKWREKICLKENLI